MSDQITLRAEVGRATGSRESRRLRRSGGVPGIIYGLGVDPINVAVDHHDLVGIIKHNGTNAIITLDLGSEQHVTMPKAIEHHPFRDMIRHVDFLKISLTEVTTAEVAVHLIGEAAGVKEGGVLTQQVPMVTVSALPFAIPSMIEIDVSALELGESLRVADLPVLEGVEYLSDLDAVVATVTIPRAVAAEGEGGEAAGGDEAIEGEETEGGESHAAAEGDSAE